MKHRTNRMPLGFLLNTVGRMIFDETNKLVKDLNIEVVELGVLWLIDLHPGRLQTEYARLQRRDATTFGRSVDKLEKNRFLVRNAVKGDRRAHSLELTASGKALLVKGRQKVFAAQEAVVGACDGRIAEISDFLTGVINSANEGVTAKSRPVVEARLSCDK